MDEVLVTGATGFVGGWLTDQLLDEGYDVVVYARTPSKAREFEQRGARIVQGDLSDRKALESAMEGVDGVFHLAAIYRLGGQLARMLAVNVDGTRNVLDAAGQADVERIVYCGSDTSLGDTGGRVCDETKQHDGDVRSAYEQSKLEAHRLVEKRIEEGQPIVNAIVSTVYGPGDESPIAELIEHHLAGRAVAHLDADAGYTFTYVEDVASALRLAYENGEVGEDYLVSGTPATFEQFFEKLSEQTGVPEPRTELPDWLVDLVEPLAGRIAPLAGKTDAEVREMLSMGRNVTRFFSGDKACRQLGWEPRSLEEGLAETLPWFRRREARAADQMLESTTIPLVGLTLFDIGLGISALVFPKMYMRLMHPHADGVHPPATSSFLARTGLLWLVFALVQGGASIDPTERPELVLVAGAFRLLDVPADIGYLLSADDLGWLGKAGLVAAPLFNLGVGAFLVYAGYRGLRASDG